MPYQTEIENLFNLTVGKYERMIYRICHSYGSSIVSPEDLFQEVMVALWLGLKSFKGQSALSTWVYRVAINTCITMLRRHDSKTTFVNIDKSRDIEDEKPAIGSDDLDCLDYLISRLRPLDKAIVVMWLDGCSYSKIAEVTGLSANTVGTRLTRIRAQLQKLWESEKHA